MYIEKYQATGNDFILFKTELKNPSDIAIRVCDRHFGVGADGILYPSKSKIADIKMNYYNSDGSIAKMCGNGIRSFARFVFEHGFVKTKHFNIETLSGIKAVTIKDGNVLVDMGPANINLDETELTAAKNGLQAISFGLYHGYVLSVGTMHTVVYLDENQDIDLHIAGPFIQKDGLFVNETNVNFIEVVNPNTLNVKTYERGAGWTLSCGTGACASAYHAYKSGKVTANEINVNVPGGKLKVIIENQTIYLFGEAVKVLTGEWI